MADIWTTAFALHSTTLCIFAFFNFVSFPFVHAIRLIRGSNLLFVNSSEDAELTTQAARIQVALSKIRRTNVDQGVVDLRSTIAVAAFATWLFILFPKGTFAAWQPGEGSLQFGFSREDTGSEGEMARRLLSRETVTIIEVAAWRELHLAALARDRSTYSSTIFLEARIPKSPGRKCFLLLRNCDGLMNDWLSAGLDVARIPTTRLCKRRDRPFCI
jgi:hypothetical protein